MIIIIIVCYHHLEALLVGEREDSRDLEHLGAYTIWNIILKICC